MDWEAGDVGNRDEWNWLELTSNVGLFLNLRDRGVVEVGDRFVELNPRMMAIDLREKAPTEKEQRWEEINENSRMILVYNSRKIILPRRQ